MQDGVSADRWHVVRVVSNQEKSVSDCLSEAGITSFCPMTKVATVRRGRVIETRQALFRNYVFGHWAGDSAGDWHTVRATQKVLGIIGGATPSPVEAGVIEAWQRRAGAGGDIDDVAATVADLRRGYRVGSEVRLQRGRDDAMVGTVVWVDDRSRRTGVRLDILGRTPVVVRHHSDLESVSAPPENTVRRRRRGGRRGSKVRERAFANHVLTAIQATC